MATKTLDSGSESTPSKLMFDANSSERIELPSEGFVANATITRDGDDLHLQSPSGETAVVKDYFAVEQAPLLQSPAGTTLTPQLVESFSTSSSQYAANESGNDESPVGAAEEVKGTATVTRVDGTIEPITIGTPIYQGDIVQTEGDSAVNIRFMDETSMAVSQNARLAIDNYSYDPKTESGETDFSVLRGMFVFTSGLIGRDDPDDVHINTPVGSIGIRGTIIAGDINPSGESKITVLEGAIVVTNSQSETTLSKQFETVLLQGFDTPMQEMGVVPAADIAARFQSVSYVVPTLFSTIEDSVQEQESENDSADEAPVETKSEEDSSDQPAEQSQEPSNTEAPAEQIMQDQSRSDILDPLLPSSDEVNLNDSIGLTTSSTATAISSQTEVSGTKSAATITSAPINTTSAHHDDIGTPPPVRGADSNATGTNAGTISGPPALTFSLSGNSISSVAAAGIAIGALTSNATVASDVSYVFDSTGTTTSANGHFSIFDDGFGNYTVSLSTSGASLLANRLDPISLDNLNIRAIHTDGRVVTNSISSNVTDTNPSLDLNNYGSAGVTVISDNIINHIGYSISALGDINDDGFDDFIFSNSNGTQNHVYIVSGAGGILADSSVTDLLTMSRLNTRSFAATGGYDTVVAGVGDYDGDGIEDYVVGQSTAVTGMDAGGFGLIASTSGANSSTYALNAAGFGSQFGASVTGVGDFNNDGRADVVIGAPGANGNTGRIQFSKGNPSWDDGFIGIGSTSTIMVEGSAGTNGYFGQAVAGIGDINGDGYSDYAVGAPGANAGKGAVKIFFGNQTGSMTSSSVINGITGDDWLGESIFGLGDINGDGLSDMLIGSANNSAKIAYGVEGSSSPLVRNINLNAFSTNYTITGGGAAGDFNGDGYDDFVVALADANSTKIYVVYGKDGIAGFSDLNYLKNASNAFEMSLSWANNTHELEIGRIGDFNGDGYDDIAISMPDANGAATGDGGVMIVHGRNTGSSTNTGFVTSNGQGIVGTDSTDILADGGFTDFSMRGGAGDDTFEISSANFRKIDGGGQSSSGYDTIKFSLTNGTLDFSDLNFENIQGIERLQYGPGSQTMILTVENLFNLMKSSDTGSLKIDATSGSLQILTQNTQTGGINDQIEGALNEMGNMAQHVSTSGGYSHFMIGGYDLYIDTDLAVTVAVG